MIARLLTREPALIAGAVGALLMVGVAFGLDLSGEQVGALSAAVAAVWAVVVRSAVVPTPKVEEVAEGVAEALTPATVGPVGAVTGAGLAVVRGVLDRLL